MISMISMMMGAVLALALAQPKTHTVRVGPTTVTVIDENESVDEVISRVHDKRRAELEGKREPERTKQKEPPRPKPVRQERVERKKTERADKFSRKQEKQSVEKRTGSHGVKR